MTTLGWVDISSCRRRSGSVIGLLIAVIALTGCLSFETRIDIAADGTADVGITMLVDISTIRTFGEMFGEDMSELEDLTGAELIDEFADGENPCDDFGNVSPDQIEVRDVVDGDRRGIECTVSGVPIDELGPDGSGPDEGITILQDSEGTSIRLVFPAADITGDSDEFGALLGLSFEDLFDISFIVSAPGTLVEHNATSVSGSTVTWQLSPDADFLEGDDAVMTARWSGFEAASGGDGGLSIVVIIAIIVGLLIVIAAVVMLLRSKGSQPPAAMATTPGPVAPPGLTAPVPGLTIPTPATAPPPPPAPTSPPPAPPTGPPPPPADSPSPVPPATPPPPPTPPTGAPPPPAGSPPPAPPTTPPPPPTPPPPGPPADEPPPPAPPPSG